MSLPEASPKDAPSNCPEEPTNSQEEPKNSKETPATPPPPELTEKAALTVGLLAAEMVEAAQSGHPGAPLGLALFGHILVSEFLITTTDEAAPSSLPTAQSPPSLNPPTDFLVLSNGHACALQYALQFLLGNLSASDLSAFRSPGSLTPGHPESGCPGSPLTTGPLGQGLASALGLAAALRLHALRTASPPRHVFCLFGDGCYQEGLGQEALSLASLFALPNLTLIFDFNGSTIDGPTALSLAEDIPLRLKGFSGLHFLEVDGSNPEQIRSALQTPSEKTRLILLRTLIGRWSSQEGSHKTHGAPLGASAVAALKERVFGRSVPAEPFQVPAEVAQLYGMAKARMRALLAERAENALAGREGACESACEAPSFYASLAPAEDFAATRVHFANALAGLATAKTVIAGCADLQSSIGIGKGWPLLVEALKGGGAHSGSRFYVNFGIREHAMLAFANGVAAFNDVAGAVAREGVFVPVVGTFLNFFAYGFPAARLAALDRRFILYVLTHDSVLLGEDGPTHQPVEAAATIRATPGLADFRPCDGLEVWAGLQVAVERGGPAAFMLTRQGVGRGVAREGRWMGEAGSLERRYLGVYEGVRRGAYRICGGERPRVLLVASGSEVELALRVRALLGEEKGVGGVEEVGVVSFVSYRVFMEQSEGEREALLAGGLRVGIEALGVFGWAGLVDVQVGLERFGLSGPGQAVYERLGFTAEKVAERVVAALRAKDERDGAPSAPPFAPSSVPSSAPSSAPPSAPDL